MTSSHASSHDITKLIVRVLHVVDIENGTASEVGAAEGADANVRDIAILPAM